MCLIQANALVSITVRNVGIASYLLGRREEVVGTKEIKRPIWHSTRIGFQQRGIEVEDKYDHVLTCPEQIRLLSEIQGVQLHFLAVLPK